MHRPHPRRCHPSLRQRIQIRLPDIPFRRESRMLHAGPGLRRQEIAGHVLTGAGIWYVDKMLRIWIRQGS